MVPGQLARRRRHSSARPAHITAVALRCYGHGVELVILGLQRRPARLLEPITALRC